MSRPTTRTVVERLALTAQERRRRKLLIGGLVALWAVVGVVAMVSANSRITDDLEARLARGLVAAGVEVPSKIVFSGQDGRVCGVNSEGALNAALVLGRSLNGVRSMKGTVVCADGTPPPATTTTTTTATTTTAAPTTTVVQVQSFSVALADDGTITASGAVTSEADHNALLAAARALDPAAEVVDNLAVGGTASPEASAAVGRVTGLVPTLGLLTSGEVGFDGTNAFLTGVAPSVVVQAEAQKAATDAGLTTDNINLTAKAEEPEPVPVAPFKATYADGKITLDGSVTGTQQRLDLVAAATTVAGAENVTDNMTVSGPPSVESANAVTAVAAVITATKDTLSSGEVGFNGTSTFVNGTVPSDAAKTTLTQAATAAGVPADAVSLTVAGATG
jgi:osmotically-inducible protein OsmY